ncbi:MAG: RNA 3'-terminal phosphate cyclase [Phycisphaerales bacterium]
MIEIDGSQGEGGGQILRTSLALSMVTGQPLRMTRIRAGRPRPGLMRQHLTCVEAAAAISGASVDGAAVGSQTIEFRPGALRAGSYAFNIGSAGGTTLVLQAILPALLRAPGPSCVVVEGGTHNLAAPPFHFLERALVPLLRRTGARIACTLERHGFYPVGGGRVVLEVEPPAQPLPLELPQRGDRVATRATAMVSRLERAIAQREVDVLRDRLDLRESQAQIVHVEDAMCPGNAVLVELEFEHITEVFSAIGERARSAESVARDAAEQARRYLAARAAVGPHLADQLMVPLAVLAGGSYSTGALTSHSKTNIETAARFGVRIACPQGRVEVAGLGAVTAGSVA